MYEINTKGSGALNSGYAFKYKRVGLPRASDMTFSTNGNDRPNIHAKIDLFFFFF